MILTLAIAAVPAFVASIVEWVEAFTIVVAVGNTRGWRSPILGTLAGLGTLAVIVGVFGTPLIIFHEQVSQSFHIVVGVLLLLFGMRWLRKSILRFAGIVALHDEELIYQREVAELRAQGLSLSRWDNIGFCSLLRRFYSRVGSLLSRATSGVGRQRPANTRQQSGTP